MSSITLPHSIAGIRARLAAAPLNVKVRIGLPVFRNVIGCRSADLQICSRRVAGKASPESAKGRYSPADCTGIKKTNVEGNPDFAHVSTSYVERSNLTMRMHMRRFTRLTNGFSKKVASHAFAVALHMMYYNFVRIHSRLRMSPAMAAGVSEKLWEVADIVALVEAADAPVKKRGSYKAKAQ